MADYSVKAIISAVDKGFSSTFQKALSTVKSFGANANKNLQTIGKTMGVTGTAVTALGATSLKSFGQFQQSLNTAAVVAGGTAKDIKGLADVANRMGAELPLSAQECADAMIEMARNGASIGDIKKQFPAIAQAATAAGADLKATAGTVQVAMNVWGESLKTPQRAAAYLTQTANLSNASIEDMNQAIGTLGPTANLAGYGMRDIATAIGLVTNKGMSAANAAQDINFALLKMMSPTKVSAAAMAELGINVRDAKGNMKSLPTILNDVAKATANMTKEQRDAVLKNLWGTAGMKAMIPLLDAVKNKTNDSKVSWAAYSAEMDKAGGSTERATKFLSNQAAEMQKNVGAKIEQLGGNWESLRNTSLAAKEGINSAVLDMINNMIQWATESDNALAQVIRGFVGLAPVIGPSMVAVSGFITQFKNIAGVVKAFISPVGLAIAAIVALTAVLVKAYNSSSSFRNALSQIGQAFSSVFGPAIQSAVQDFNSFMNSLTGGTAKGQNAFKMFGDAIANVLNGIDWNGVATTIKSVFDGIVQGVQAASPVIQGIVSGFQSLMNILGQVGSAVGQVIQGFMQTQAVATIINVLVAAWNNLVAVVKLVGTVINSVVQVIAAFFTGLTSGFASANGAMGGHQTLWQTLGTIIGNIVTIVGTVLTAIINFCTQVITFITNLITQITTLITPIATFVGQIIGQIIALITNVVTTIISICTNIVTQIVAGWNSLITMLQPVITAIQELWQTLQPFMQTLWQGIVSVVQSVWNVIQTAISTAFTFIQSIISAGMSVISAVWQAGWSVLSPIVQTIWGVIKTVVKTAINVVANIIKAVTAAIKGDWSTVWNSIKAIATSIWNGIKSVATTVFNGIKTVITNVWNGVKSVTSSVWNGIKSVVTSAVNGIKSIITSVFNAIKTVVTTVWNSIKTVTSTVWNSIKSLVTSVINAIKSSVTSGMNGVKSAVTSAMNAVKSAFVAGWNAAKNAVTSGVRACVNAAKSMVSAMASAGRDFVMGFVNGIKGAIGQAAQAAANMAKSAVNAAKSFLHIHSPSRIMRDQVGYYVAAGMAVGIENNTNSVVKAANSLAEAAIPDLNLRQMDSQIKAMNNKAQSSLTSEFSQTLTVSKQPAYINVNLGGHDYDTFVDDISRKQDENNYLKRRRM